MYCGAETEFEDELFDGSDELDELEIEALQSKMIALVDSAERAFSQHKQALPQAEAEVMERELNLLKQACQIEDPEVLRSLLRQLQLLGGLERPGDFLH